MPFMSAMHDSYRIPYTVTWINLGGSTPSIGNGTLEGWYQKTNSTYDVSIRLVGGTTTNWGTAGKYIFTTPVKDVSYYIFSGARISTGVTDFFPLVESTLVSMRHNGNEVGSGHPEIVFTAGVSITINCRIKATVQPYQGMLAEAYIE